MMTREESIDEILKLRMEIAKLKVSLIDLDRKKGHVKPLYIKELKDTWKISEHGFSYEKEKPYKHYIMLPKQNVKRMHSILSRMAKSGEDKVNYRSVVPEIIDEYGLKVDVDSFNGGRNRRDEFGYFYLYYYPLKVLDKLGVIRYTRHGDIDLRKVLKSGKRKR